MSYHLLLLVILTVVSDSFQTTSDNKVSSDDNSEPLADVVNSIRKEQVAENIGAMVQNLLQDGGGNVLGNVLGSLGNENAGQLLAGLSSLMSSQEKDPESDGGGNAQTLLENLGGLMGNLQGEGGGTGAEALLQGLGSLLTANQQGGGFDPSILGSLVDMFSQEETKKKSGKKTGKKKGKDDFDLSKLLGMAASFMGMQGKQGKASGGGFMSLLPTIIQTFSSFTGPEAREREASHSDHVDLLPPFLEKLHVNFDHFMNSDMGKQILGNLAGENIFRIFLDDNEQFNYDKFGEMIENISFRRYWIRAVTDRAITFLQKATDPEVYKDYMTSAMFFANSFLKSQGFPKETIFDPSKPTETLTAFTNYVAKNYFNIKIDAKEYVKPTVQYAQDILLLTAKAKPLGKDKETRELGAKLADTINLEILEPIIRVNRAYRFGKSQPKCIRYVLCLINEESQQKNEETIPALKRVLYKGASLIASWYLSSYSDIPFWTLYSDVTHSPKCKSLYVSECDGFHTEEMKATTEYLHVEL